MTNLNPDQESAKSPETEQHTNRTIQRPRVRHNNKVYIDRNLTQTESVNSQDLDPNRIKKRPRPRPKQNRETAKRIKKRPRPRPKQKQKTANTLTQTE